MAVIILNASIMKWINNMVGIANVEERFLLDWMLNQVLKWEAESSAKLRYLRLNS